MRSARETGGTVAEGGYDYFLVGKWEAEELLPALAEGFRVRPDEVDIAYDEDGAGAEDRNWDARVLCNAHPVGGDCSWYLDVYALGPSGVPDSRTLGLRLARWSGRVVLYSAPLVRPSAYWMATPDGRVGRARMYDPEDDWPDGTWRLEAVELTVPQLSCVAVDFVYEMIGDEMEDHRPVHTLRALVAALRECCPEGGLELRGSLAAGTHDRFSDFDLRWTVPGERFAEAVAGAGAHLGRSLPLLAARSDPELHGTPDRRLLTYFFRDPPLIRRLDLEVRAAGGRRTGGGGAGGPGAGAGPSHWMPCRHPAARAPSAPERSP